MKKQNVEDQIRQITVLVPERGSYPHFLISAFRFAHLVKSSVKLIISERWKTERPQKITFYHEVLEEHLSDNGTPWNTEYFKNDWKDSLGDMSSFEEMMVVLKDEDPALLREVILESPCPVLVIPKTFQHEFKKVLLSYIGGRFSARALRMAVLLGHSGCCQMRVVTVGISSSPALRVAQSRAKYFLDFWKVSAKYQTLKGNTEEKILEVCVSEKADLLILGASETHQWKDHRFRTISQSLVEQSNCPVMIVK